MIHDLKTVETSQKKRSWVVGVFLACLVTILFLNNFKVGLLAAPFAIVTALVLGRISVIRYDDAKEQLEIVEYCPWLPWRYQKVIPRKNLKSIVCTIYYDDDRQELYEVSIGNTAGEFIPLREQMRPDDGDLTRFAALLNLEIIRRPA